MKIKLHEIPVRDVVNGYIDSAENGVVGYGGKLNIRPAFQRSLSIRTNSGMRLCAQYAKTFRSMLCIG